MLYDQENPLLICEYSWLPVMCRSKTP